MVRAHDS